MKKPFEKDFKWKNAIKNCGKGRKKISILRMKGKSV